ncbi:NUDIX hydrolase [Clostridiaceae bacterium 35-E11]
MIIYEKTLKSQKIYEGKMIDLRVDTVKLPGEKHATREIVEHPGAVAIVPITEEGKIIMIKQFRKPVDEALLEVPAGKLDENEDPSVCAARELKEETGYEAENIKFLFKFYTSPGFSNEIMYLYVATQLTPGEAMPDEDEYIDMESYPLEKLLDMIHNGEIKDSKTIIGIMAAKTFLKAQ